eukprot:SAG11_NODE_3048_length_2733_cov_1.307897_3_plen_191_part_00
MKFIQELFIKISQDGAMGVPEWKRCLRAAGIFNEVVSERLFTMFDTSGDKQMNAKEFTWGLSDICSEEAFPGTRMTPLEVRREFAYRYYDETADGFFEKTEAAAFLKSWVAQSEATVRSANERFMGVYGLDHSDLELVELCSTRVRRLLKTEERHLLACTGGITVCCMCCNVIETQAARAARAAAPQDCA